MNTLEMIYEFELLLGTLDATIEKPKTSDTLNFLNLAQRDLYMEAYHVMDVNEEARKLMHRFQCIDEKITPSLFPPTTIEKAYSVELPEKLNFITREAITVNVDQYGRIDETETVSSIRNVVPISIDYYNANIKNPFRQPNYDVSWRIDLLEFDSPPAKITSNGHILICAPGVIPSIYWVSYVTKITSLQEVEHSTCEFPEWYHDAVVKRAVSDYVNSGSAIRANTIEENPE